MPAQERPLVMRGLGTGNVVQFWRLEWEMLEADRRPGRYVLAPLGKTGDVLVATPDQFRSVVMRGPRADSMRSRSWRGDTKWARDDRRPGGSYLFDWIDPAGRVLERLVPFIRRRQDLVAEWAGEVDVIRPTGNGPRIEPGVTSLVVAAG